MAEEQAQEIEAASEPEFDLESLRPRTRGDCAPGGPKHQRPCVFASCQYHLAEPRESARGVLHLLGSTLNRAADAAEVDRVTDAMAESLASMHETCALDVADRERGDATLETVGQALGVTRERVRQIEMRGLRTLRHFRRAQRMR